MAAAIPFIMAAGAVMSAVGALQQGQAAKQAADYNSTIATQNAQIARQNAADKAMQADRETYLRLGAIRANQGASGGNSGEGSVLDVIGDVAAQSELEKQQIVYQGEMQARGFTNDSTLDTFTGETQQRVSYWKAGGELLSGGSKAYNAYGSMKRS